MNALNAIRIFAPLLLSITLVFPCTGRAKVLSTDEKLRDLDQIVSIMKSGYGPLHYKTETQGLELDQIREKYANKIRSSRTNAEFYYLLVEFVAAFRDSHFSASLPSGYSATLPFSTDLVEGKVLIDTVNKKSEGLPFARGDEIVEINGQPVSVLVDQLQKGVGAGNPETARRKAAMRIAMRSGAQVPVPAGHAEVTVRNLSGALQTVKLNWEVTGSPIDEADPKTLPILNQSDPKDEMKLLSIRDYWEEFEGPQAEDSYRCSGRTRITIPADATIIMQKPFVAYYHPTPKGNIGYLRIGEYQPQGGSGEVEYDARFAQYEYAIGILEKETVGLIIDQDHNCGGSVDFMHRMAAFFIAGSFRPLQFQLLANKENYILYRQWFNSRTPYTPERENLERVFNLVKSTWETNEFLTPLTAIDGALEITPNHVQYTKPIVMLVDEMSGSGGDAFPALMQGYGRAKVLGNHTMGAGGNVRDLPPLNFSQVKLKLTKSLFYRPDGIPVENNGVTPDYPYLITKDDFIGGYLNYQAFYVSKLLDLIGK